MATNSRDPRTSQLSLFDERPAEAAAEPPRPAEPIDPDASARQFAVDPRNNVVLEASAGTGKTSVLVARYLNLLRAGVEPANILAITFTRKAAAEMRERIVRELRAAAATSQMDRTRWNDLRDRLGEIAISTIDAFCLSLLREFPLEADVDPAFEMADETEVPRLIEESLDQSLRIFTSLARTEPDVALVLAQLGLSRTREGLAALLDRRLVAWGALDRFLAKGPSDLTSRVVCRRTAIALQDAVRAVPGGLGRFLAEGPVAHPRYQLLQKELSRLAELEEAPDPVVRAVLDRVAAHFLTAEGRPRTSGAIYPYRADHYPSPDAAKRHRAAVAQIGPHVERVVAAFKRDLNVVMARGVKRMFGIALAQYRRALDERSVLDFSDVLQRALDLLRQMDEFAQSRYRLESRYHHVLVDEFQDTSRAQWELVSLLVQSWGEGLGLATQPSVFIVGDRKQSIYRFRDAEVAVLRDAGRYIEALRPDGDPRRSISRSFRAVPELLSFVNDTFTEMSAAPPAAPEDQPAQDGAVPDADDRPPDEFTYRASDRFPVSAPPRFGGPVLGLAADADPIASANAVAAEIERILKEESVRDRNTGVPRKAAPGDIAILFRSRTSHREFERALEQRGIPTYVYKGLGFFDADETKDVVALLRYLARPASDLRAAAFMRSRFVRLSDRALSRLAPDLADALTGQDLPPAAASLDPEDLSVLEHVRSAVGRWIARVDRVPPADLLEEILVESAYAYELRGARRLQAWENLKKLRAIVRRIQNRGYATLPRIAEHIDALTAGDESNAVLEALDAVNLMTVHASKGLEFPVVFVVNLARGASGPPRPVRVVVSGDQDPSVSIGPFVSDADEADREREKHETRRLLYVAFTRARDRLYLASVLKDGVLAAGRGSLAEVLPESLKGLFARAAGTLPEVESLAWQGLSGQTYEFKLCRPAAVEPMDETVAVLTEREARVELLGPAVSSGPTARQSTSEWAREGDDGSQRPGTSAADAVKGRLVHRLIQHSQLAQSSTDFHALASSARQLLTDVEVASTPDADVLVAEALAAWTAIRHRPEVLEILSSGHAHYEVPFSSFDRDKGLVLRGTIDCLVVRPDGSVVVLEFKTGAPHPSHARQLDAYVRAAGDLFPGKSVQGQLVYPSPAV